MSTITTDFKLLFMKDKHYYDSLSQAIKLAKTNGVDDKALKPLVLAKQEMKDKCAKNSEKLLKMMPLSENIVHMDGFWYSIRFDNGKDLSVKQECIKPEDTYVIKRDGRHESELRRQTLDDLMPAIIYQEALDVYKQQVKTRGASLVYEMTGVLIEGEDAPVQDLPEGERPLVVKAHAGMRWVQRVIKHAEKDNAKAEEYRRLHVKSITDAILESYGKAERVWENDHDNITYWYNDEANLMFVVDNNNIITLYEEDFGFHPHLNRLIVREQLGVLAVCYDELKQAERNHEDSIKDIENNVKHINDELEVLEARTQLLISQRATLNARRDESTKEVRLTRAKYDVEYDKLFKKWEVPNLESR